MPFDAATGEVIESFCDCGLSIPAGHRLDLCDRCLGLDPSEPGYETEACDCPRPDDLDDGPFEGSWDEDRNDLDDDREEGPDDGDGPFEEQFENAQYEGADDWGREEVELFED